jgi:hypothetical protein
MKRTLGGLFVALLLVLAAPARADAAGEANPCSGGTTTFPSGVQSSPYENKTPAEDQIFDGPNTTYVPDAYDNDHGIELGENLLRDRLCLGRVNVKNVIDPSYEKSWRFWHDSIGGHGAQVFSKSINIGDMYIHGGEDGIKLQNCAEGNPPVGSDGCHVQQPGGIFVIKDVAIRNHHDDAIDDDDCMPGTIDNVLIEGHTGISVQEESSSSGPCQSSGEGNINLKNSIIRTMPVNAYDGGPAAGGEDKFPGGGKWFKWDEKAGTANDHHTLNLTNVALVVDRRPRSDWSSLNMPGGAGEPGATTWAGTNFILYLNTAGEPYGGPMPGEQGIPSSVTFLSGAAAKTKFEELRNDWLTDHGCTARPAGDINPKDDPMCRVTTAPK